MSDLLTSKESAIIFHSRNKQLVGIHHIPEQPSDKAVVIVVGGPQTRVGSHRQFVLLAREFASKGIHAFRFDYTGAGDSEGELTHFSQTAADIEAAVQRLCTQNNSIKEISLWGLCDAASAILIYLNKQQNNRIKQVILLNPWVRQEATQAKMYLRYYYVKRIFQRSFWGKLFCGRLKLKRSIIDINRFKNQSKQTKNVDSQTTDFVNSMLTGGKNFQGKMKFILSENDLTADEYQVLIKQNKAWRSLMNQKNCSLIRIAQANHTFSHPNSHLQMLEVSVNSVSNL